MPRYDAAFFDYVNSGAVRSAQRLLPHLLAHLQVSSVLDVGCGVGAWLKVWRELGIMDVMGIDGEYVEQDRMLIPVRHFQPHDLRHTFDLQRRFDLVQSLEVAEHLPPSHARGFVASLVRHGAVVLFSAAPPGQGGDHHINEQEYDYWRELFAEHGYLPLDCLRPALVEVGEIEVWYRYNTILYVDSAFLPLLPRNLQQTLVPSGEPIRDLSPMAYRIRKALVRRLPVFLATLMAKIKERLITACRRRREI